MPNPLNVARQKALDKTKKRYQQVKINRRWIPPSVAERKALYDRIYEKTSDGKYIISSDTSNPKTN